MGQQNKKVCVQRDLYMKDSKYIDETFQYSWNGKISFSEPSDGIANWKDTFQRSLGDT